MDHLRSSGLLLHLTSLPGSFGIGDLGPAAYRFVDFLARTGQRVWQVLPLVPVGHGHSPYSSPSTFAANPLLISPERLRDEGLLTDDDLAETPDFPAGHVDFGQVLPFKYGLLEKAFDRFESGASSGTVGRFVAFCERNADWLDDYALFMALKHAHGDASWTAWPAPLAARHPEAIGQARQDHARRVRMHQFWQYLFDEQWSALKAHCRTHSVRLFGDLPIYVAHDSADVWSHPELYYLDDDGHPTIVAGVPPDYFSETGQRWGNPLYRWDRMRANGYWWWTRRLERTLSLVDFVRLDHFRGFAGYWEIPAHEETAVNGRWVKGPGAELFFAMQERLGPLPVVAENLGIITPDVVMLMEQLGFPGMAVLQFGFSSGPDSDFLPHNYTRRRVAYSGTHDNDTLVGWWRNHQSTEDADTVARAQRYIREYLDLDAEREQEIHWVAIRALMASVADTVVIPLQDVLGLGSEARMNTPGLAEGNWSWRFTEDQLTDADAERLRRLTEIYGRAALFQQ